MKKTFLAVALVVFFVMALAVPAFAQSMVHVKQVDLDATSIDWELQAGHLCNTGAELKQTIMGSGVLEKTMITNQVRGRLIVDDDTNFVAGATNLAVISVIELCAPPKYIYEGADVHPAAMYNVGNQPYTYFGAVGEVLTGDAFAGTTSYDQMARYDDWDPVSLQIWAAHVNADPGFSGRLKQDFTAAYGPYLGLPVDDEGNVGLWDPEVGLGDFGNRWRWDATGAGNPVVRRGATYLGNFFDIEQHMRTSQGAVQRFIDISSPWTGAYVSEDMTVVGKSEIQETFVMMNLGPGADIPGDWWRLF